MKRLLASIALLVSIAPWSDARPRYVATIHPLAEILHELVGERGEVIRLIPPDASPHTYEPRPSDAPLLAGATALFFVAPDLDGWAANLQTSNKITVMDSVPKAYRLAMEAHHHTANDHDHAENEPLDSHFWTDPLTVKATLPGLLRVLSRLDEAGTVIYQANAKQFGQRLDSLHEQLKTRLQSVKGESVMLFHPSMRYMLNRYGLTLAGTVESAPGKEPSPRYLIELVHKIKRSGVKAIFTEPQLSRRSAESLAEAAGVKLFELDPIGGTEKRMRYDELLLYNARVLEAALK